VDTIPADEVVSHVFEEQRLGGHEHVAFFVDRESGLRAIIAVHSTRLGPALGGTRFYPFRSEGAALVDVLRLSQAMSYKSAAAGLDLGGGKAVVIGDPATDRSEELLAAYGRCVERLAGAYITTEDVGTTVADMRVIRRETRWVTGAPVEEGGSGDPSPATAVGVFEAMRAAAAHRFGSADLAGRHVTVAGVGKVGSALVGHLLDAGARVTVADVNEAAVAALGDAVGTVAPEKAHAVECDIFSPCALGPVLAPTTIPELRCDVVCGSANNQLATPACGSLLAEAGVLYVPDYVANAGGVINLAFEIGRAYRWEDAEPAIRGIHGTTVSVLARAEDEGISPAEAADRMAEERMAVGLRSGLPPDPRPAAVERAGRVE
jgi:valine dehydrogenase (NAD+)